jgi:two-component system response regulator NreC
VGTRLLIVDDHPLTRDALASLLGQHGFTVIGQASDGAEAVELSRSLQPDLILLDLSMPGLDGISALPRLHEAAPRSEIVVLTASETQENLLGSIRAGAAGYLLKTEPPERIVEFLGAVAKGEAALSGAAARRLLEQVREGGYREPLVPDSIAQLLSARELEVLLLLDDHLGTDEIAKRLYISVRTAESHRAHIMRKLRLETRAELVRYALAHGLLDEG